MISQLHIDEFVELTLKVFVSFFDKYKMDEGKFSFFMLHCLAIIASLPGPFCIC